MSFRFPWLHSKAGCTRVQPKEGDPAANQAEADYLRGVESGAGEAPDYGRAAQWYAQAAERNHAPAQFSLAMLYTYGQGVERDGAQALRWLTRAAKLGNPAAQYRLGVDKHIACRKRGQGSLGESRIEALTWLRLSAAQGHRAAEAACEFVALEMTRAEVAECARRVEVFVPARDGVAGENGTAKCSTE